MCIGIALALHGMYVQSRRHTNPAYVPSTTIATRWLYDKIGSKVMHPSSMLSGNCNAKGKFKQTVPHFLMRAILQPVVHYSGYLNAFINLAQIVLLKVYYKNLNATNTIIALSVAGWIISFFCLSGALATCKLMCLSCLGIHHLLIIYLACRRRKIVKNIWCPSETSNSSTSSSCNSGGTSGKIFGNASQRGSLDSVRRRSGR